MKNTTLGKLTTVAIVATCSMIALNNPALGQGYCTTFPTNTTLSAYVTVYPNWNVPAGNPLNFGYNTPPAWFAVDVEGANELIPAGIYPAWCVDQTFFLPATQVTIPGTAYSGTLISTCDPLGLAILPDHGGTPPVGPPPIVSLATWHEINYILNNTTTNDYWWNVQVAISRLVGGPAPNDPLYPNPDPSYPPVDTNQVDAILAGAESNSAAWTLPCGGTIGVLFLLPNPTVEPNPPEYQIIMLQVPCTCPPIASSCVTLSPIQGSAITPVTMTASGGCGGPYTFTATGLPPGLTMSTNGTITGTTATNGVFSYTVTVTDNCQDTVTVYCSVTVTAAQTPPPCNGQIGYFVWNDLNGNGCQDPGEPGIPGVKVDLYAGCPMSGSPIMTTNTDANGHYFFSGLCLGFYTVSFNTPAGYARTVANAGCTNNSNPPYSNQTDSKCTCAPGTPCGVCVDLTAANPTNLNIDCGYVAFPSANCIAIIAVQGSAITPVTLVGSGGCGGPYAFSGTGLPIGLTMSPNGTISGTPGASGTFNYSFIITDSCGNAGTNNCSVTVYTPPSANCVTLNAVQGRTITPVTLVGSGGCGSSYTFTATGLPGGLTLSNAGTISGTPNASGTFNYSFVITDSCGFKGTNACAVTVLAPPGANCVTINATNGTPIKPVTLVGSGGCGSNYTFTAMGLPGGLTLSTAGTISGTPTASGTFNYTFIISDSCGNKGTNACAVTVSPPPPPVVNCPPNLTLTNTVVPYCTFAPGDYGAWCNGSNAASILTNCFKRVYTNGFVPCGITNATGYCLKFANGTNVQNFFAGCGGTPRCLQGNHTNPTNCEAGIFAGQALCLELNVNFGDAPSVTGFPAGCGNLILNDPTCPLDGQNVRQILGLCNTALGGGNISACGCTLSNLTLLCSNLNESFENGSCSAWGQGHLVPCAITNVSPAVTGYATVVDTCPTAPTLTYSDVITAGACVGNFVIARTWTAVDACGNSNSCTQEIYVGSSQASVCGAVFLDCNGAGILAAGFNEGMTNIPVTLENSNGVAVAKDLTGAQGAYCFYNLTPGTYTVVVTPPTNWVQTAGTSTNHWINSAGQQCWIDNDSYQHCKGSDCVDRWTTSDSNQHYLNANGQDCWTDRSGNAYTQNCTYVSCDLPTNNAETFTLSPCEALTCVNFAYRGNAPKAVVCVTGPSTGICGQTGTYTCTVTNTGTACFSACNVTACGNSYPCPVLSPGQGCSFQINHQYQYWDCGQFNCQATANCTTYSSSNNSCTAQGNCSTSVSLR